MVKDGTTYRVYSFYLFAMFSTTRHYEGLGSVEQRPKEDSRVEAEYCEMLLPVKKKRL